MKKFVFPIVPISPTYFPTMAIPALVSQLRHKGYDVHVMDLNIKFFQEVYSESYLNKAFYKAEEQYKNLENCRDSYYMKKDSSENKLLTMKYNMLNEFFKKHRIIGEQVPLSIDKALKILKNENLFYNPKLLQFADNVIQYANKMCCLPYIPFDFYRMDITYYDDIYDIIFDEKKNLFYEFFIPYVEKIKAINPSYIGISITFVQQVIPGLTLAYLLKKHTNAHINIGGNYFTRFIDYLPTYRDFFERIVDSVSYGEGENSILELAKFIDGEIPIEDVSQLIYKDKKSGEMKINKIGEPVIFSKVQFPDYSDFDLKEYLFPVTALPIQIQRGCYWNKCAFCDFPVGKKPVAKQISLIIEELKHYKEKYNVTNYFIIDEAIHPKILLKLVDALIEANLGLKFNTSLIFEKEIDYNLLKKMYMAGFRSVSWGFETASDRILKLINKGIDLNSTKRILKDADKACIYSRLYVLTRFPTAKYEDDIKSLNFLKKYSKYIPHFLFFKFKPTIDSKVYKYPDNYKVEMAKDKLDSRISVEVDFVDKEGMTSEEKEIIYNKFFNYQRNEKFKYFFDPYYFILYSYKYDLSELKKILLNEETIVDKIKKKLKR